MTEPFVDQVAVVTGAARGLGRATAERLAAEGARVALFDRDGAGAEAAARRIGQNAHAYTVDIADEANVQTAVDEVLGEHGRVDVLVNNAGIYPHTPFERADVRRVAPRALHEPRRRSSVTQAVCPAMSSAATAGS